MQGYTASQLRKAWNQTQDAMHDTRFLESLSQVESIGKTKSIQTQDTVSRDALNSIKSDFNKASSANSSYSSSMDKLHSIQTAKTNYENSSSNFDKQFTNMFVEDYVGKYGAGAFEELVRENPNNVDSMVKDFIQEKGLVERLTIGEVNHQKDYGLNSGDLLNIENAASANNIDLNASSDEFIGQSSQKSEVLADSFSNSQKNFAKQNDETTQHISSLEDSLGNIYNSRKEETGKELNQLASEKAFNRIKNEVTK
jgi:hypothetical protein